MTGPVDFALGYLIDIESFIPATATLHQPIKPALSS
jgi:hypothetical protein